MVKHIVNYDDKVYKSSNWQDADQLAAYMVWRGELVTTAK